MNRDLEQAMKEYHRALAELEEALAQIEDGAWHPEALSDDETSDLLDLFGAVSFRATDLGEKVDRQIDYAISG